MFDKLTEVETRYQELTRLLAEPDVISRRNEFQKLSKEHSDISELVTSYQRWKRIGEELGDNKALLEEKDPELRQMAREEAARLEGEKAALEERMKLLLLPKDPNDDKNILLEIRGGTGGEEAALFAGDLFRMYTRYAERRRWKVEILTLSEAAAGGIKEAVAVFSGDKVYSALKYESGVHRVQRVPATEAQGRIHTSAATVAVLPEGGGDRPQDRREGSRDQGLALGRARRAERQHHRLRGADPPHPVRHPGALHLREVAAQEQGAGDEDPARQALRDRGGEARLRRARRPPQPGGLGATAPRRSAPTTSRRTASPTTASATPATTSPPSSTAISIP